MKIIGRIEKVKDEEDYDNLFSRLFERSDG